MNGRKDMAENVTVIQKQIVIKDYAVGIYARVSTSHKAQMDSLSAQISGLTRLVGAHRTWFIADIFLDVASAQTGSKRSEFNRMINECEHGNLDIILTKSLSRFGRDAKEGLEAIRRIYDWYLEGYSIGGIIDKLEEKKINTSKSKERWSKRAVESTLTREKYTGDVAIADSGGSENRYLYKQYHEGIISKE